MQSSIQCRNYKTPAGCSFGNKCNFSHDPLSEQAIPVQQKPKKPCRDFVTGKCTRGKRCWFSHDADHAESELAVSATSPESTTPPESITPPESTTPSQSKASNQCTIYATTGTCHRGDKCDFVHGAGAAAAVDEGEGFEDDQDDGEGFEDDQDDGEDDQDDQDDAEYFVDEEDQCNIDAYLDEIDEENGIKCSSVHGLNAEQVEFLANEIEQFQEFIAIYGSSRSAIPFIARRDYFAEVSSRAKEVIPCWFNVSGYIVESAEYIN